MNLAKNGFVATGPATWAESMGKLGKREYASSTITAKPMRKMMTPRTKLKRLKENVASTTSITISTLTEI